MKKIFLTLFLAFSTCSTFATTAPDFTANDCLGNAHNLYTELNAGKVIVLVWVMPCGSCVGPALTAYNVAQSFSNPNVLYYLIDDAANTSCTSLNSWANSSGIGANRKNFSSSSITESNYGGIGMPHVAIVATSNHTFFFNELNTAAGNASGIQTAISDALIAVGISKISNDVFQLSVFPSPANQELKVAYTLKEFTTTSLEILNESGQVILSKNQGKQSSGNYTFNIDISALAVGNYVLRIATSSGFQTHRFNVLH